MSLVLLPVAAKVTLFVITSFCVGSGNLVYIETLLFHTVDPNRNVLFQLHLPFVTIYVLIYILLKTTCPFY